MPRVVYNSDELESLMEIVKDSLMEDEGDISVIAEAIVRALDELEAEGRFFGESWRELAGWDEE